MGRIAKYVTVIPPGLRSFIRDLAGLRLKSHAMFVQAATGQQALEIGGPSGIFRDSGLCPLYPYIATLDNCVFARETIWEGTREDRTPFVFEEGKSSGLNYIRDATNLEGIADNTYGCLLASHCLEHIANPVKALREWIRVLKPGGATVVVLPDYRKTFDHRRQTTAVSHMLEDHERSVTEDDSTHLAEVLELHDFSLDPIGGDYEQFRDRVANNTRHRWVHHHVFDENNSRDLLASVGMTVKCVEVAVPHHIVLLAEAPK
jgi:SAM-dependent methyltransferase